MIRGADWRETNTTVAHDDGGHTMPARWRELAVPGRLAVIVRVDVDEAGLDKPAVGVDFTMAGARHLAYLGDDAVGDRDIGGPSLGAASVDDSASADNEIMLTHRFPFSDVGLEETYFVRLTSRHHPVGERVAANRIWVVEGCPRANAASHDIPSGAAGRQVVVDPCLVWTVSSRQRCATVCESS